jgi:hypothetical protein
MFEWVYGLSAAILYPAAVALITAAGEIGNRAGLRHRGSSERTDDIGILTGAALGLLALLLAFSFSIAPTRYDARRNAVLEEANGIGSAANFALALPDPARATVLGLLRDYARDRVTLGVPYDPAGLARDIAASLDLQAKLWAEGMALTAATPQSLPVFRFVGSLNELNNIHEARLSALRAHVPGEVMFMLLVVSTVAIGFAGYNTGVNGTRRSLATALMAVTIAGLVVIIVDLDRPARGFIRVPVQPLVDAAGSIPQ